VSCVLFEDDNLLVVNKPAGVNTHAPSVYSGEGIYDWLRHREPRWAALAIIHRLDKETSGLIVFSKTTLANQSLTHQFTQREVEKKYLLLTDRKLPRREFLIKTPIVRAGERYRSSPGGKSAQTRFRVLREGALPELGFKPGLDRSGPTPAARSLALLEAEPLTGRTHQIRVHATENGFPILGDDLYGGSPAPRLCLHAAQLHFRDPQSGEHRTFEAPADFAGDARLALRGAFIEQTETNSWRLLHGAADGSPELYVDKLGDFILAQSPGPPAALPASKVHQWLDAAPARGAYYKRLTLQIRKTSVTQLSPQFLQGERVPERFAIRENGLHYELSFNEGYSAGLFLDQRDNRRRLLTGHIAADFALTPQESRTTDFAVLNTFAYTCGFSVCAAKYGARVTSVDLSKKYLEWGKRNFGLNGLDAAAHDFIYGDVFDWLRRFAKQKRKFVVILLDPPTFSASKEHGAFRARKDYPELLRVALPLLAPDGILFASSNAADWPAADFMEMLHKTITASGRRIAQDQFFPQPPDFPVSRAEPAYLKTAWFRVR
jgi:23S rRNA (cytosine1962-C5)-methyltransferase